MSPRRSQAVLLQKLKELLESLPTDVMLRVVGELIDSLENTPEKKAAEETYKTVKTEWRIDKILGYSTPELRELVRASLEESEVASRFIDAQMEEEESD